MIRRPLVLLVSAALLAAGCGGDDDDADTTTTTAESTSSTTVDETSTTEPTDVAETPDLERRTIEIEPRRVTFANLTYTVLAARVTNQDLRSIAEGTEPEAGDEIHLVLDVRVTNDTGRQLFTDDDTIGLDLGEERVPVADPFLWDVIGPVRPATSVDSPIAFPVDALDLDPSPFALLFGTPPDVGTSLSLTGSEPSPTYPVALGPLDGSADGTGPTNGGTITFTVLEATAFLDLPHGDTTSPTGERADLGELFLQVRVRAEKTDGRGNDLLAEAFRLVVDGVPRAAFDVATAPEGSTATPTAEPGTAVDAWVLFLVDDAAESLALSVGDATANPGTIPLPILPFPATHGDGA